MVNVLDCYINKEISLNSMGVYLPSRPCIPANVKDFMVIPVPGRDSNLTVFKGWQDRILSIEFHVSDFESVSRKLREIRAILLNAKTIMFSEDMDVFYKIKNIEIPDIRRELSMLGAFTVNFMIEPFDYYSDENIITITDDIALYNMCTHTSKPRLKIYGTGNLQISINSQTFQINNVNSYVEVDTELMLCYEVTTNKEYIGDYPVFELGNNNIILSSNITKVEIEPRWRYI